MTKGQNQLLRDLVRITNFKATSDLPHWLKPPERETLRAFLEERPEIEQLSRYRFKIEGREVDFAPIIPLSEPVRFPPQLALYIGMAQMGLHELIPGMVESLKARIKSN
ncbi:MAG: hypothetical protein A3K41_14910 [Chloroflexi bacterium RIFOXYD12_FULL_57_15]|nr:MAG: hypothetical protein A3K41_14910 [Chloroflexi bacterium RIFOXYD12_FULL_57_15]